MVVRADIRTRDDGLDDGLAVGTLASTVSSKRLLGLLEAEAMCDQWLEVNLASSDESNSKLIIPSLRRKISMNCYSTRRQYIRSSGRSQ